MMLKSKSFKTKTLYTAIICALNALPFSAFAESEIEIIEVTATKKLRSIQEVPVTVQAMSGDMLDQNNIGNFDELAHFMPNVTLGGRGPGQADIFIRGMAIQPIAVMLSGAQGTMPNVALYLDEQPVSAPGRNLDVFATDLQRIEVLAGPQGTLFGASSQAGTVRYITNKPNMDDVEISAQADLATTKSGDLSKSIEAMLNLPVNDQFALRLAVYDVQRGGYIDNRYGEFTLDPAINPESNVGLAGATYDTANNAELVKSDFNSSSYQGFRLGGLYQFNDDWQLLVQHAEQEIEADGVFDYDPEIGDLAVERHYPDRLQDEFSQTSWTLEGRLAALDVIYTGAFLDRDVQQTIDYTGYNNTGAYIAYYTCTYDNPNYIVNYDINPAFITQPRHCLDATKGFIGKQAHQRLTHELRVSGDFNDKLSFVTGLFIDDFELKTQDDYHYLTAPLLGFVPNAPISGANNINDNTRLEGITFFNDVTRKEQQIAVFGELSYQFTEKLNVTAGIRWYEIESDLTGSTNFADGIFQGSTNTDRGRDYDKSGGHSDQPLTIDDVIPKLTFSYQWQPDILMYGSYSEGFRPGGFNRGGGIESANPDFPDVEITYDTDNVINYELGWKSLLFDKQLRLNANLYYIDWQDMQVSRFDPQNVSILTFIENAADSKIRGFEADISWQATDNLTLDAAFSLNDTEITAIKAQVIELAPEGSELPLTPKFQGNIRARYDWEVGDYQAFWLMSALHAGESWNSLVAARREKQASYQIFNAAIGLVKDNWSAKLYIDNITDKRAEIFINDQDDTKRINTSRPRTIGLSISYSF